MNSRKGRFFVFEGIDGSGKSTQIQKLAEHIRGAGYRCHITREPTDRPIGKLIRQVLTGEITMDNQAIAPLFVGDRMDHLTNGEDGLCQMMEDGVIVLCDRYYFSSYAYHSVDMPMDWVISANSICADRLRPTATLFLDITPETAMARINAGRESTELFETNERLTLVRGKYFEAFDRLKEEEAVVVIDGNRDIELLADAVWQQVQTML